MNLRELVINTIQSSSVNPVNREIHDDAVRQLRLIRPIRQLRLRGRDLNQQVMWVRPPLQEEHLQRYLANNMESFINELDTYLQHKEVKEVTRIKEFTAEGDVGQCAICQENIKKNDKFTRTACSDVVNHFYHTTCCSQWFKDNNTCPMCRADLSKN